MVRVYFFPAIGFGLPLQKESRERTTNPPPEVIVFTKNLDHINEFVDPSMRIYQSRRTRWTTRLASSTPTAAADGIIINESKVIFLSLLKKQPPYLAQNHESSNARRFRGFRKWPRADRDYFRNNFTRWLIRKPSDANLCCTGRDAIEWPF